MSGRRVKQLRKQRQVLPQKDRRLRFTWNSNSSWSNSGYGVETRDLLTRFVKDGWNVAQIAFYGLEGSPIKVDGMTAYPKMMDGYGSDALYAHSKHFGAHIAFSMQDVQIINPFFLQKLQQDKIPWICYCPIDKEPVPEAVLANLRYAYKIITFSEFGYKALQKKGFASTLIKEGTDTNIFKPMDKKEARKTFNLPPDKFIVGMVGANKPDGIPRKGWQEALDAFKLFHEKHPEAIYFFTTNQPGGFPILDYAQYLGIKDQIFYLDEYMATYHLRPNMNAVYNSFDMLIHPSTTEGFGLCVIEAMSAGIPVIVNNCTSMPEMIIPGVTGEICETKMKMWLPGQGYIHFADSRSLYEQMNKVFQNSGFVGKIPSRYAQAARKHVLTNYDIDVIVKTAWIPLLKQLQEELLGPPKLPGLMLQDLQKELLKPQLTNIPLPVNINPTR